MEILRYFIDFILHIDVHLFELVAQYGLWIYAILFIIVFCETGLVVTPFLPGDSLLFVVDILSSSFDEATGTAVDPVDGLPTVTMTDDGPTIAIVGHDATNDLKKGIFEVLRRLSGEELPTAVNGHMPQLLLAARLIGRYWVAPGTGANNCPGKVASVHPPSSVKHGVCSDVWPSCCVVIANRVSR